LGYQTLDSFKAQHQKLMPEDIINVASIHRKKLD